jgi:hypothetical protein
MHARSYDALPASQTSFTLTQSCPDGDESYVLGTTGYVRTYLLCLFPYNSRAQQCLLNRTTRRANRH